MSGYPKLSLLNLITCRMVTCTLSRIVTPGSKLHKSIFRLHNEKRQGLVPCLFSTSTDGLPDASRSTPSPTPLNYHVCDIHLQATGISIY